jgi:hypothetical protein
VVCAPYPGNACTDDEDVEVLGGWLIHISSVADSGWWEQIESGIGLNSMCINSYSHDSE